MTAFTEIEPRLLSLARDADTDALAICSFLFEGHQARLPYFVRYAGNSPLFPSVWLNTVVVLLRSVLPLSHAVPILDRLLCFLGLLTLSP